MDALALLCNLHADGPFTLQRLRRAGCDSLAGLLGLGISELSEFLDGSERTAERFLREAELLSERLEDSDEWGVETPEEEEDYDEEELDDEEGYAAAYGGLEEEEEEYPEEVSEEAEREIAPVLDAWREADRDSPPEEPVDYLVPRPKPPEAANRPLDEVGIEGLRPRLEERLRARGILSLKGLIEASTLELAQSLGLPFTRVKHLQFLARRAWATPPGGAPPEHAPAPAARARPVHAPARPADAPGARGPATREDRAFRDRLDTAGPFASEPGGLLD